MTRYEFYKQEVTGWTAPILVGLRLDDCGAGRGMHGPVLARYSALANVAIATSVEAEAAAHKVSARIRADDATGCADQTRAQADDGHVIAPSHRECWKIDRRTRLEVCSCYVSKATG